MSMFGSIMSKIFGHPAAAPVGADAGATQPTDAAGQTAAPAAPAQSVDIGAVLASMAAGKSETLNYETSIVDLLKLLDLDSSLEARKTLASELNVHAGADGSAEENVALHKAVVQKLEENGGKVPASMKG